MTSHTTTLDAAPWTGSAWPTVRETQGLSVAQRRGVTTAIVGLHLAAVYGLMQVREIRATVRESAPMFVDWIAPTTPEPPVPTPSPPPSSTTTPRSISRRAPAPDLVVAAPSTSPSSFDIAPPEPTVGSPASIAVASEPVSTAASTAPASKVIPAPAPKLIPASAVDYLVRPGIAYPRQSIRNHETGTVVVRVFIDAAGLPRVVEVGTSSGRSRLDEAALAGVRQSRFKPYTEGGKPTEGWAFIPVPFELEK